MSKKKKPLVEVKVQSQTMYEGIGAKGQKPFAPGIRAFKRAKGPVVGSVIRDFKDKAWATLKKIEVPIVKGNTPRRKGNPYVRTR